MVRSIVAWMFVSSVMAAQAAVEWRSLDPENHLGGRKASSGYLQGKVVLVSRWGARCPPCRRKLPRLEEIWKSFKSKPFVVVGGHCKGWGDDGAVKALIKENNITFPVYENAGLALKEPDFDSIPFWYVVDETGAVKYKGSDDRVATEVIVTELTNMEVPSTVAEYRRYLDYELKNLPGRAYLRMLDFKKRFPMEAKGYAEKFKALKGDPDVEKLAELVAMARKAKDLKPFDPVKAKAQRAKALKTIENAISKYEKLKQSGNPLVVQEAKNALADLKWAKASL